ncbi:hypothetical protein [Stanieria cyanosphaera]|nr:hypothetical protein [Stanieria cyanosphaera]
MPNPNKTCFFPEPDESRRYGFGSDFVANEKYLAVGHTGLNKVIIYTSDDSGQWSRTREIRPPVDLAFDREGSTFGNGLELDGDILTISARIRNPDIPRDNLSPSQAANTPFTYSYRRYLINLKTETEVQPIDLLVQREPESNLVRFNLLRQGKIEQFVLPDMGEEHFGTHHGANSFYGSNVAVHENLLLVGYSSSYDETGGAWLFNLAQPEAEPLKMAVGDVAMGSTVALSQQFAAVSFHGITWYFPRSNAPRKSPKTLIANLNNGSTTVINSFGELSLSGNILAVMRPGRGCGEVVYPILEVFRIDEDTTPHLIIRRKNVSRAKVQNVFLIFLHYNGSRVCIEPLP